MPVLDKKDWKILFELDLDSRQSLNSLGKKTGLSKEVVNYRIRKMVDSGIITNFFTRIDTSKLGIMLFRVLARLYNLTPAKEKSLVDYIVKQEKVGWCVLVDGSWDLNFIYWADSIADFSSFLRKLLSKYGDYVMDKQVSVFDRYIQFPKLFLLRDRKIEVPSFSCGRSSSVALSKADMKLLVLIAANSRLPTVVIAEKTGVSAKSVSRRIKALKKEGIIQGFGISLGLAKIGFEYFKLHLRLKRFDSARFNDLIEFARYNPFIIYTNELIGGADLELDINVENEEAYHSLLNEIRYKFPDLIRDFESLHYYKELKHNLFPRKPMA